jgi:transposase
MHAILTETLGEHASSYATVKNWVAQFDRGDFSTCDVPRPGRPKTVTTPEIIDQIHELILYLLCDVQSLTRYGWK